MNGDHRHTGGPITDVLDVLERHGYHYSDDRHAGRAAGLVGDLARIYAGTQETPAATTLTPGPEPRQAGPGRARLAAVSRTEAIAAANVLTILSALDEASDYKRGRAERCADCSDQSCGACQLRLDVARDYENLADQLQHALDAATPGRQPWQATAGPPGNRAQPRPVPEKEAGQ